MQKLTKEQAIIVSGYTDFLICEFDDLHKDIEKRLGRSVFTHDLPAISVRGLYRDDFIAMQPEGETK